MRKTHPEAVPRGELALIEQIRRRVGAPLPGVRLGIGDDCAILRARPGEDLVVTTDLLLEGRHFRRDWHSPQSAGHRALARGLSDIAAMGARPLAAFLSLALPPDYDPAWMDGFLAGLLALAAANKVSLAGGDTAQAPGNHILADMVLIGSVRHGRALRRSGARAGESLYVSGSLGGSALQLRALAAGTDPEGNQAQTFPEPRLALGQALVRRGLATAAIDLSDGLSTDLTHLAKASGCGARLSSDSIPLAPGASLTDALHGGEDYELLFTSARAMPRTLAGSTITRIGTMTEQPGILLEDEPLAAGGWQHLEGVR